MNSILTRNPHLLHRVIPGRRWLQKRCRKCGDEVALYGTYLQPFDEFLRQFDQETIDRAAQLQARTQAHINQRAHAEELRLRRREKNVP